MTLIKSEKTRRLDDLNLAGMEAMGLYEDILGHTDDDSLSRMLEAHIGSQRTLLERIVDLRRQRGELPQAADPERSHLEAAEAFIRAAVLPGETSEHYVESLLEAAGEVETHITSALALDLDAPMRALLEALRETNAAFETALQSRL